MQSIDTLRKDIEGKEMKYILMVFQFRGDPDKYQ